MYLPLKNTLCLSVPRDLLVAPGLWDPWVQLVLQDDR